MWRDGEGRVAAYAYTSGTTSWVRLPGVADFAFDPEQDEVTAFPDGGVTRGVVADAYRRVVLPMVQQARGNQVLHASAVRASVGVVAFCGTSGTGKSTVAFAFSVAAIPCGETTPCASTRPTAGSNASACRSIFCSGRPLRRSSRWGWTQPRSCAQIARARLPPQLPLLPSAFSKAGSPMAVGLSAEVVRLSAADAFTAALEHAYALGLGDRERRKHLVEQYLQLSASAPVFKVSFERGLERLEAVVDAIEQHLRLEPPTE